MSKIKRFLNSDSNLKMTNGEVIINLVGLTIAGAGLWFNTYVAVKEMEKNSKLRTELSLVGVENLSLKRELENYKNSNMEE